MVSLGEAIALQGRNTIAEQIGRMSFQQTEAAKNRKLKAQEAEKDQEAEILKLFRNKSDFHRLVAPKVNEAITKAYNRVLEAKTSGTPFSSNQYLEINRDLDTELRTLKAQSDALENFDAQTKFVDRDKKYFGRTFEEFMPLYQKARSVDDLRALASQNPNLTKGRFFNLAEDGTPLVNPTEAIPVQRDLGLQAKQLKPIFVKQDVVAPSGAYGARVLRNTDIVPYSKADRDAILKANPGLKNTQITTIEDIVDNYIVQRPDVIEQVADRANLGYEVDADGLPTQETIDGVKEVLMKSLQAYTAPKTKDSLVFAPQTRTTPPGPTPQEVDSALVSIGSEETYNYGGTPYKYKPAFQSAFAEDKVKMNIPYAESVTNASGTKITGEIAGAELKALQVLPYKLDGNVKRPIKSGESGTGYEVFSVFTTATKAVFIPLDYLTVGQLTNQKYTLSDITARINALKARRDQLNK